MMKTLPWSPLKQPSPALYQARLELHWALQIPAAANRAYMPAVADQSHSNFAWHEGLKALVGNTTPDGLRLGLRFAELELLILDADGHLRAEHRLVAKSLPQGYDWLTQTLAAMTGQAKKLDYPSYDLPEHELAQGQLFSASPYYLNLTDWFSNAHRLLSDYAALDQASPVRCWPHHMDIATLLTLEAHEDHEKAKTVGLGLTPGDEAIPEPYWYVTPWPYPEVVELPALAGQGQWHTEGWLGALLTASEMTSHGEQQAAQVKNFLHSALEASKRLLRVDG
jgi:hypothetical protein